MRAAFRSLRSRRSHEQHVETATEIRPFVTSRSHEERSSTFAADRGDAWPERSPSTTSRRACNWRRCRHSPLLGDRLGLAPPKRAQRAPAVHDRDRRRRHPLHPRPLAARGRVAADHDPRLARLGHRAARGLGPLTDADPTPAREDASTWCCRPCPATASPASRPTSAGTPAASPGPGRELMDRLGYTATSPRRRLGAPSPTCWAARHPRAARHPPQLARAALARAAGPPTDSGGTRGSCRVSDPHATAPATSSSRPRGRRRSATPARFTGRPRRLDARPRHRQLLQDLARLRRRRSPSGSLTPGRHPRQHHAVLADHHGRLRGPVVLGERTSASVLRPTSAAAGLAAGRLHPFPGEIFRARAAGSRRSTPTSSTSTRPRRAATSPAWETASSSRAVAGRIHVTALDRPRDGSCDQRTTSP